MAERLILVAVLYGLWGGFILTLEAVRVGKQKRKRGM